MDKQKVIRIRKRFVEELAESFADEARDLAYFVALTENKHGEVGIFLDEDSDIYAVVGRLQALAHALLNRAQGVSGDDE